MNTPTKDIEVRADGTVILPAEWLAEYGISAGDRLQAIQTGNGILIAPRKVLVKKLLDELGDDLKSKGYTFEAMLDDNKAIRQEIYNEKYAPKSE